MPAVITHHLFGEDAAGRLPEGLLGGPEELLAFLLANQGPDPFFVRFSAWPPRAAACHQLASAWHAGHVAQALFALRAGVARLPEADEGMGRAFALGVLAHYVLDSRAHPFVYAQQHAIVEADPSLAAHEKEVHAIIESDLDAWMLKSLRGQTVAEAPLNANLARTDRICRVGGALFSQAAMEVFDIQVGPGDYAGAVDDYALLLALLTPPRTWALRAAVAIERLGRTESYLEAMAPHPQPDDACPAANLSCRPWRNEATGELVSESFGDVFYGALEGWPAFAEAFVRGDRARFEELAGGINYNGARTARP